MRSLIGQYSYRRMFKVFCAPLVVADLVGPLEYGDNFICWVEVNLHLKGFKIKKNDIK